jgi:putative endonuclease
MTVEAWDALRTPDLLGLHLGGQHGTLYVGITNDLSGRILAHKEGRGSEFVRRYGVTRLVWYEACDRPSDAIAREKQIKRWRRDWKTRLIEEMNPLWIDLYPTLNM